MAIRSCHNLGTPLFAPFSKTPSRNSKFFVRNCSFDPSQSHKLVLEVKDKLGRDYTSLPVGKNGRDDEDMILWFLRDRKFSVDEAVSKLTKAIRWRQKFGVSELTEDSVKGVAESGKAYLHDSLDVYERPVLVVVGSKHFPDAYDPVENQKLCVFLIEKAMAKLPPQKQKILAIVDLRGFKMENSDINYLTFLFDVFYYYYPKRLDEVLFVDAPFIFQPIWQLAKPLLKSYASLWTPSEMNILQNKLCQKILEIEGIVWFPSPCGLAVLKFIPSSYPSKEIKETRWFVRRSRQVLLDTEMTLAIPDSSG